MAESKNPWDRGQATVKLVGRRKELLERVARACAPGCSPVEAIDSKRPANPPLSAAD